MWYNEITNKTSVQEGITMQKSVRKFYEYKRSYDRADFDTMVGRRVVKKRAHKRLRKQPVLI